MEGRIIVAILAAILVFGGGYLAIMGTFKESPKTENQTTSVPRTPSEKCQVLCRQWLARGDDLSDGPCLSNAIEPGWVCDVTHKPRQPVDDVTANTCSAYGKNAQHFVEVDPECNFIGEA